jgi:hypothetical protein
MSLVQKPKMTDENLAARRANGSMSQGAVAPEGKARVAAANLRHGFNAQAQNGGLAALGEDPQKYADPLLFRVRNGALAGSVKSLMKENATMERQGRAGGFAPRPPGFIAWVPGWKGVGERVSLAPNPSRPRSRRSGRIPAEPYPPPRPR